MSNKLICGKCNKEWDEDSPGLIEAFNLLFQDNFETCPSCIAEEGE